jgi:threonine dehydratase
LDAFPTYQQILDAADRIKLMIHNTPVMSSEHISDFAACELFFKCENFQKVGAFKMRGAANAVSLLSDEEADRGVATHSSGNHAAALAKAAQSRGIKAYIVMPNNAPGIKKKAVLGYGGTIIECEPGQKNREAAIEKVLQETGAEYIHPFNDYRVITGQATCALEFIKQAGHLDVVLCPVGGGGLLSGTALTFHYLSPSTKIMGGEPEGADDAFRSLKSGKIESNESTNTIADGLLTNLGDKTFPIIQKYVDRIITVSDTEIVEAMRLIWERMKIIIEPSCAVPLAAVLKEKSKFKGKRVGIILSGGNVDLSRLPF